MCVQPSWSLRHRSVCRMSPTNGICAGGTTVIADGNYWRPSENHSAFVLCDDSVRSCHIPGKKRIGYECAEGYEGPLCSVCMPGFGKQGNFCVPCPSQDETIIICVLVFLGQLLVILVMVFISCPDAPKDTNAQGEEFTVGKDKPIQKAKRYLQKLAIPLKKITKIVATWLFCLGALSRTPAARRLSDVGKSLLGAHGVRGKSVAHGVRSRLLPYDNSSLHTLSI